MCKNMQKYPFFMQKTRKICKKYEKYANFLLGCAKSTFLDKKLIHFYFLQKTI